MEDNKNILTDDNIRMYVDIYFADDKDEFLPDYLILIKI